MRIWIAVMAAGLALLTLGRGAYENYLANQDVSSTSSMVSAAKAFGATLDETAKKKAMVAYSDKERVNWQFVPLPSRKGLPMMDMTDAQKTAAKNLLKVAVSQLGFEKATKIMSLENVLHKLEKQENWERRNPNKYYFTVYGTPSEAEHWGLSIEGHHLSLNFVMQGDKIVDSTPQFFATNPAELKDNYGEGFEKGLRVLREEESVAFELLGKFNAEQKKVVQLAGDVPKEIRAPSTPQPPQTAAEGLMAGKMEAAQKETLRTLLKAYTDKMRSEVAKERWKLIEDAGFDKVAFAWSGADKPGIGHYYRVQGPTFLVEFINVQADAAGNPANHIHCVWRDLTGDFDLPIK